MHNKKYMVSEKDKSIPLIVEKTGFEGVRKIDFKISRRYGNGYWHTSTGSG